MPTAANTAKRAVKYGVEKVYYAIRNDDGTYGKPKPLPGAVSITLEPKGESNPFYADNSVWFNEETNAGYTGKIELAYLDDDAYMDLLGERKDAIGGLYDDADASPAHVALLWETGGNVRAKHVCYYDTTFSRPSDKSNTKTDKTDPDTFELDFASVPTELAVGEETVKTTRYSIASDNEAAKEVYVKWFDEVAIPQAAAA